MKLQVKRFDSPDEKRDFELGRFELLQAGGTRLGRACYQPGWKWSEHVGAALGQKSCPVDHVGYVLAGRAAVRMDDGTEIELREGDLFSIPAGHDSWVVGDQPYLSLHLVGADEYAVGSEGSPGAAG